MFRRTLVALAILVGVGAAAGLSWYGWRRATAPTPPEIAREELDPELADAIEAARRKIRSDPYSAARWGDLGKLLRAAQLLPEAAACFAQAEQLDGKDPQWPYLRGEALRQSDVNAALPPLERAVNLSEKNDTVAPHLRLAEVLLALGRNAEAETQLHRALAIDRDNPSVHYNLGLAALAHDDLRESLQQLKRAEHSPVTQRKACIQLAVVCRRLGDREGAEKYSRKADALPMDANWTDPFLSAALEVGRPGRVRMAERLEQHGRYREAAELATELVRERPDYRTYVLLGQNLGKLGDLDGAKQALRSAIVLEPDSFRAYQELGGLLWMRGESLRTKQPERAKVDFQEAAEAVRHALARRPNHAMSHVILGLCQRGLGQRKEALASFRAAVDCGPDVAAAHLHLGEELAEAGQVNEARTELQRAAQLAPSGDERARAALSKLKVSRQP